MVIFETLQVLHHVRFQNYLPRIYENSSILKRFQDCSTCERSLCCHFGTLESSMQDVSLSKYQVQSKAKQQFARLNPMPFLGALSFQPGQLFQAVELVTFSFRLLHHPSSKMNTMKTTSNFLKTSQCNHWYQIIYQINYISAIRAFSSLSRAFSQSFYSCN